MSDGSRHVEVFNVELTLVVGVKYELQSESEVCPVLKALNSLILILLIKLQNNS